MAFTFCNAAGTAANPVPIVEGNRRLIFGHLKVDNSYTSGTGFACPATVLGLTMVKFMIPQPDTTMANLPTYISGGANATFKVWVLTTAALDGAELASTAGSGLIFPFEAWGI